MIPRVLCLKVVVDGRTCSDNGLRGEASQSVRLIVSEEPSIRKYAEAIGGIQVEITQCVVWLAV